MARPTLEVPDATAPLARLYHAALDNLAASTVPARRDADPRWFLRAGGGCQEPWTRDAAINAWNDASVLEPDVARDTLLMVCHRQTGGARVIAQDDQWWDQIIWVVAAWHHYLVTGDEPFALEAFQVGRDSLAVLDARHYRPAVLPGSARYSPPLTARPSGSSTLRDFPYRRAHLNLRAVGAGSELRRVLIDERPVSGPVHVGAELRGDHMVTLELGE